MHVNRKRITIIDRVGARVREVAERSDALSGWLESYNRIDLDRRPGIPYSL